MSEMERIEYLLELIKNSKYKLTVNEANKLVLSYKWLLDKYKEVSSAIK